MAGVKISALPSVGSPSLTDIMPEVQPAIGGITYKVSFTQLLALFQANIQITESQVTNLVNDLDGKVAVAGDTMTGFLILNADPIQALGAATKQYVDNVASGLIILLAVYAASTVNLTATYNNGVAGVGATLTNSGALAAFSIDGVSPPFGSRILVKDQTSTFQNGIYSLTTVGSGAVAWVLTRSTDYDTPAEIQPGDLASVNNGVVNAATGWLQTATVVTIGTDPILWSRFGGVILPLAVSQGGTGATTAAGARANLGAAASGANADITSMLGLTGVMRAPTAIQSAAGENELVFNYIASAVNYITVSNNSLTGSPRFGTAGADPIIALEFSTKGGPISISDSTNTNGARINFYNAAHTHGTVLNVAAAQTTDLTLTLPAVDGTANQALVTNGSGLLSFATVGGATTPPTIQRFTSGSGTYTTPVGAKFLRIRCWGGGGGGGGCTSSGGTSSGGGGGGGAGYVDHIISSPVASYSYSVGAGGAAAVAGANPGGNGGNTTFSILTAGGGLAGGGGAGTTGGVTGPGGSFGTGTGGNMLNTVGHYGGVGFVISANVPLSGEGGTGALGGSGGRVAGSSGAGIAGNAPGGGGGGGVSQFGAGNQAGSTGGNGEIIVEEYY